MTATRRQRQHAWTVVAGMRRAVGSLRYVNDELTRVSEAIFRPAGAPLPHTPAAPLPWPAARRQRPPDTPAAPPDLARRTLTAVMTVPATPVAGTVMRRRGRARRGHRGRSVRTEKNIWPVGISLLDTRRRDNQPTAAAGPGQRSVSPGALFSWPPPPPGRGCHWLPAAGCSARSSG